jgi:peptide/nickel transport system substrate-binding protein
MTRTRVGALVSAAVLLFAACGPAATTQSPSAPPVSPGTSPAESPSASPGESPVEGGTLVVALPGDIDNLDPTLISDSNTSYVINQVMEGLVQLKAGSVSEVEPVLAESYEVSDDGLTYTFKIRTGKKFHDGTDLNAEAIRYNFDRWLNKLPEELQPLAYYAGAVFEGYGVGSTSNVKSIEAPDETTFVVTLNEPRSNFLLALTLAPFYISSPEALEAGDANNPDPSKSDYAQRSGMVGTGPFKLDEWVRGDHLTIVKNEDYEGPQQPAYLDEIVFRPFPDQTAEFNALEAGEVDFAQTIAPIDAETIGEGGDLQVINRGESCNMGHLALNQTYDPVKNKKIRQAIAYALNKQSYIDTFYAGQAVAADNWLPPSALYYKELGLPTYDPAQAEALIAEAQAEGVTDLTIDFWYPSDVARPYMPDPKGLFEAIQSDLEEVGFTINPNTATWNPDYLDAEEVGEYEAWLIGWTCDWASADNFLQTAFFGYRSGEPNPEYAYENDELIDVMNRALASTDEQEAADLWSQAQDMVAEDLPTIPLVHSTPPAAAGANVRGIVGSGALNEYFNTAWLAGE